MVVTILSAFLGAFAGAALALRVRRARIRRRSRQRWPGATWATETTALRLRLTGTLSKRDYRTIVEAIAARDAVERPVSLPLP